MTDNSIVCRSRSHKATYIYDKFLKMVSIKKPTLIEPLASVDINCRTPPSYEQLSYCLLNKTNVYPFRKFLATETLEITKICECDIAKYIFFYTIASPELNCSGLVNSNSYPGKLS